MVYSLEARRKENKEANLNYSRQADNGLALMCSSTNIQTKQMNYLMEVKCMGEYTCMQACRCATVVCICSICRSFENLSRTRGRSPVWPKEAPPVVMREKYCWLTSG